MSTNSEYLAARDLAERLRPLLERLAEIDRASCSMGEHLAAELIAAELRHADVTASVEYEEVHGTYWWPLGLTSGLGLAAAKGSRGRPLGLMLGLAAAALVFDELGAGRRPLRRLLPKQPTANVVGLTGDQSASETLIIVSHHDAAHSGFFFDPRIGAVLRRLAGSRLLSVRRRPRRRERILAPMVPMAAAPALAGIGASGGLRRVRVLGAVACAGIIAAFVDMASRPTVPGANDNLTGVVTLLAVARSLKERPVHGLRVILVSTGAEEALMEGMRAFASRHFPALDLERTRILCVDAVGSPHLVLARGEGMLRVRPYDQGFNDLIVGCADELGVPLLPPVTMRLGTDGYVALRHGVRAALLMSLTKEGGASNYHWPTDTPERVDDTTVADAIMLCRRVIQRLAEHAAARSAPAPGTSRALAAACGP